MKHQAGWMARLLASGLALVALGGCSGEVGLPATDTSSDTDDGALARCHAPEQFVITAVQADAAACIGKVPRAGDTVVLAGGRLRFGERDLVLGAVDQACVATATGCTVELAKGDRAAITATLDLASGRLTLDGQVDEAFRPKTCTPAVLQLAPRPAGCFLGGRFNVKSAPTLTGGSCDLTWSPDEVTISVPSPDGPAEPGAPIGVLRWGTDHYDIVAVDAQACTVTAQSGLAFFNGVARTTSITATLEAGTASFAIEDALDGKSDFGETCVAARFSAAGDVVEPGGAAPWGASCPALPFSCGDGICASDVGEQCWICEEDCGCTAGTSCISYVERGAPPAEAQFTCAAGCNGKSCSDGQQCVAQQELDVFWYGDGAAPSAVCFAATDDVPRGGACADSRDCAPGLACAQGQCLARCAGSNPASCGQCVVFPDLSGDEMCVPKCSPTTTDQCGAGTCGGRTVNQYCSSSDGAVSWFCHPAEFKYGCTPATVPAFGEACTEDGLCDVAGGCVESQCTRDGTQFDCAVRQCSHRCETDADCAAPLARCSAIPRVGGGTPSRWCMAGP